MPSSSHIAAVATHESGYRMAARALGIKLRPTRLDRGLRRYFADVIDVDANDDARETAENMALVMLCGAAALLMLAPGHERDTNDAIEAGEVLYNDIFWRGGTLRNPNVAREFHNTLARLQTEAESFVHENRAEIVKIADKLAATAAKLTVTA